MRDLEELTRQALAIDGIESAAIFVTRPGSSELDLGAAAGIDGPALDGLVAAVKNPVHPIARALTDAGPTYDVEPMNPGGPALRSHLPLGGRGVLAVSHETSLSPDARRSLERLAASATKAISAA
jgi:hypothetical protein